LFPLFVFIGTSVNILRNRDQLLLGLGLADTYEWYVSFQLVLVCLSFTQHCHSYLDLRKVRKT